jgi:hypothetical protein
MSAMHDVTMKIVNMIAKKMSIGRLRRGRFWTALSGTRRL